MKNIFWAALHLVPLFGSATLRQLQSYFGDGETVWHASKDDLQKSKCLGAKRLSELIEFRKRFAIEQLEQDLKKYAVNICVETDNEYPKMLKEIFDPPFIFYYQGKLLSTDLCLGIVGSRLTTPYGKQVASSLAFKLAKAGFTIVSGAAKGIDTQAHIGALRAKMRTIAVLGCGLDIAYPAENKSLLRHIAQNGAVISEYPLKTLPLSGHFPARNRIINGLSKGIIVVEAAKKSGSLITAELALSEGRDVFAVPGNIYSTNSQGCHKLIQQGAKLVASAEDIIEEYQSYQTNEAVETAKKDDFVEQSSLLDASSVQMNEQNDDSKELADAKVMQMNADEKAVYEILSSSVNEAKSTDEIIYKLRINVSNIAFILLQMKLKGLIAETSPNCYIRSN